MFPGVDVAGLTFSETAVPPALYIIGAHLCETQNSLERWDHPASRGLALFPGERGLPPPPRGPRSTRYFTTIIRSKKHWNRREMKRLLRVTQQSRGLGFRGRGGRRRRGLPGPCWHVGTWSQGPACASSRGARSAETTPKEGPSQAPGDPRWDRLPPSLPPTPARGPGAAWARKPSAGGAPARIGVRGVPQRPGARGGRGR